MRPRIRVTAALVLMVLSVSVKAVSQPDRQTETKKQVFVKGTRSIDLQAMKAQNPQILAAQSAKPIERDQINIALDPGEFVFAHIDNPPTVTSLPDDSTRFRLQSLLYGFDADGVGIKLSILADVAAGGLRIQSDNRFGTSLFLRVQDLDHPAESRSLESPVTLLVTAHVDQVAPTSVSLSSTNDSQEIVLSDPDPQHPVQVSVRPSFATETTDFEVAVIRPGLVVRASPTTIQGLGLETSDLTVSLSERTNLTAPTVALSTDRGKLASTTLTLSDAGMASTTLRSISIGTATVRAESRPLESTTMEVRFAWPWRFFLVALLGGAIGGSIHFHQTRKKSKAHKSLQTEILLGVAKGLVVAVAWAVGVNLLGAEPSARAGEAVVFVLSAIGAIAPLRVPFTSSK